MHTLVTRTETFSTKRGSGYHVFLFLWLAVWKSFAGEEECGLDCAMYSAKPSGPARPEDTANEPLPLYTESVLKNSSFRSVNNLYTNSRYN